MLGRHMLGYAPSLVVTALMSVVSVTVFTHMMSQEAFGQYSLAMNMMTALIGIFFFWLQNATSRLLPQVARDGHEEKFIATVYLSFMGCAALLAIAATETSFLPLGDWRAAVIYAPFLAILRSLVNLNQAAHRAHIRIARYNRVECGQALIGFAASVVLLYVAGHNAASALIGSMIGLAFVAFWDRSPLCTVRRRSFDTKVLADIVRFGMPFVIGYVFSFILSGSDRFLIQHFMGAQQVGLYSAGYAFPDRIGQIVFMAVATASFPLTVRRLEQEGLNSAREQTYANGVAILALAIPACVGLLMIKRQLAAALIGPDFRAAAIEIMPWITLAAFFNGLAAHYFDHAFHLAKRTGLYMFALGPAALFNLAANFYAIPRYGIVGAAYTTLAAYVMYFLLSVILGRRVFAIKFPFVPAAQILVASAMMALALGAFDFPENAGGLMAMMGLGAAVYGGGLVIFNVMEMRDRLRKGMRR